MTEPLFAGIDPFSRSTIRSDIQSMCECCKAERLMLVSRFFEIAILTALTLAGIGCGKSQHNGTIAEPEVRNVSGSTTSRRFTEEELARLLVAGTSRHAVTNRFGTPASEVSLGDGEDILIFIFPENTSVAEGDFQLSGFDVRLKDDKVVRWEASHTVVEQSNSSGEFENMGEHRVGMTVVDQSTAEIANEFETTGKAQIPNLSEVAGVTLSADIFVAAEPRQSTLVMSVKKDSDIENLAGFTRTNISKRMLISAGEHVVSVVTLVEPIPDGRISITTSDPSLSQKLKSGD